MSIQTLGRGLLCSSLLFLTMVVQAQNPEDAVCLGIIEKIAQDRFTKSLDLKADFESHDRLCETIRSAQSKQTSVSGNYGVYGGQYSDQNAQRYYKAMCSGRDRRLQVAFNASEAREILSDNGARLAEACVRRYGVKVQATFDTPDSMMATIWYETYPGLTEKTHPTFTGSVQTEGEITCEVRSPGGRGIDLGVIIENRKTTLTCLRNETSIVTRDDVYGQYQVQQGGLVRIPTTAETYSIVFPEKIIRAPYRPLPVGLTFRKDASVNVCDHCIGDYRLITDTPAIANDLSRKDELRRIVFETPPHTNYGDYVLSVTYAANEERPAMIKVNGKLIHSNALKSKEASGWSWQNVKTVDEAIVPIRQGVNVITFERHGSLAHIQSARLRPLY